MNVAYDGDFMAVMLVLDNEMVGIFETLEPHRNIPGNNSPFSISGATEQQPPQTLTMYNYLYGGTSEYNTIDN